MPFRFIVIEERPLHFLTECAAALSFTAEVCPGIEMNVKPVSVLYVTKEEERYDGQYDVTPLITSQVLRTQAKFMEDDVRIKMIPTEELSNESGGVTFVVG